MEKLTRNIRPPLGVTPSYISEDAIREEKHKIDIKFSLMRVKEISESIIDYAKNNRKINQKWVEEYNEDIQFLENHEMIIEKNKEEAK